MLEETLDRIAALGEVNLFKNRDGTWSAALELPAPEGVTAKIHSGFKHKTHLSALQEVEARLNGMRKVIVPGVTPVAQIVRTA